MNCSSNFLEVTNLGPTWSGSLVEMVGRVGLSIGIAVLVYALRAEGHLVYHTERVNRQVVLVAIEHASRLLGQPLIENLLRMMHRLLMMHVNWLLAVVD